MRINYKLMRIIKIFLLVILTISPNIYAAELDKARQLVKTHRDTIIVPMMICITLINNKLEWSIDKEPCLIFQESGLKKSHKIINDTDQELARINSLIKQKKLSKTETKEAGLLMLKFSWDSKRAANSNNTFFKKKKSD